MDMFCEVFVSRLWALAAEQLNLISRLGRRVLTSGRQLGNYARRTRNRAGTFAIVRTVNHGPITIFDEPNTQKSRKSLRSEADAKRLEYENTNAQGVGDFTVDYSDRIHIIEASYADNFYGGNRTACNNTGTDKLYVIDEGIGTASNRKKNYEDVKGKIVCDHNNYAHNNNDGIGVPKRGDVPTVMTIDNDNLYVIDVDAEIICKEKINGKSTSMEMLEKEQTTNVYKGNADYEIMDNYTCFVNPAAVFDDVQD